MYYKMQRQDLQVERQNIKHLYENLLPWHFKAIVQRLIKAYHEYKENKQVL